MNLNWQHLMYFKCVAELENFSKAADALYVTNSAISKAINNMEDELGFPLFQKRGRKSVLTEYGKTFYQYVAAACQCINDGIQAVNTQRNAITGRIAVGGIYTMCAEFLPRHIKGFKAMYPDVSFSMEYHITNQILEDLRLNNIDLGFCGNFMTELPKYAYIEKVLLYTEELVVIVPNEHPLAGLEYTDFGSLKNEPFIIHRNRNSGTTPLFEDLCGKCGFAPHISFEVPDDQSILGLVKAGLGIALIADSPSFRIPGISTIRLEKDPPVRKQYMVWEKNRHLSPAVIAFRDYILANMEPTK